MAKSECWAASLAPGDFECVRVPFIVVAGVAGVASYLAVEYAVVLSERIRPWRQ